MSNEIEREKLFSESVDRLITGQAARPEVRADPELDSALNFARKMTDLRAAPSPQFSTRLREKLLGELDKPHVEDLRKEKSNWCSWFVSHRPVWQAATAVFVIVAVIGIAWAAGVFKTGPVPVVSVPSPSMPASGIPAATTTASSTLTGTTLTYTTTASLVMPSTTRPIPATSATGVPAATTTATALPSPTYTGMLLAAGASTSKTAYLPGETVKIDCILRNVSLQPLVLEKLPPIVSIMQTDTRQPVYTFRAGTESRTLASGETVSYTLTWNQSDFNNLQVSNGSYYVELEDLDYQGKAIQLNLSTPARFDILPSSSLSTNAG
jgi:hypothetical protein